jgi:tetratricopeptide (TPR) repeat protein
MTAATENDARPAAEHTVVELDGDDDDKVLRLTVELPMISSVKEVNLDVSSRHIEVTSELYAPLQVDLDREVNPEGAKAKFVKKTKQLRVDLPVKAKRRSSAAQQLKQQAQAEAQAARAQRSERMAEQKVAREKELEEERAASIAREVAARKAAMEKAQAQEEAAQIKILEAERAAVRQSEEALEEATARKTEGNAAFKAKDYSLAETKYADALRAATRAKSSASIDEMVVVLHSNRAEALLQLSRFDEAAKAARAALQRDPSHSKSQQRLQRAQDAVTKQKQKELRAKKKATQAARKQDKQDKQDKDDGIEEFFTEGYLELEKSQGRGRR